MYYSKITKNKSAFTKVRSIVQKMRKPHLVQGQVEGPQAEKHHAVSQGGHQHGTQAQQRPQEAQQLHGRVRVQAEPGAKPQQAGGGEQLLPQRFATVAQLPACRQQAIVAVETCGINPFVNDQT